MPKVLIIDDDAEICSVVSKSLGDNGFIVDQAHTALDAKEILRSCEFELVLIDWNLPDSTGLQILRALRESGNHTPVIMLTGMSSIDYKTDGLESGADDYITKPFDERELLARINAVLRRPRAIQDACLSLAGVTLDLGTKKAKLGDTEVELSKQEFLLLEFLMKNPGRVFSHTTLVERAWSSLSESSADTVRVTMSRLRKKLGKNQADCPIKTVHGLGYRFVAEPEK